MKVLYISSNHEKNSTLMAEEEITELQMNSTSGVGRKLDFIFLPALAIEDIEAQLAIHKPAIVHISAHGEKDSLEFIDARGVPRKATAEVLRALFAANPPRLVYLNACDSDVLSQSLAGVVPYAIGTTAPISNYAARKGAVAFYRAIAQGRTLGSAFASSLSIVNVLDQDVKTVLSRDPAALEPDPVLYEPLRLVAHLSKHEFTFKRDSVSFELGLIGCPPSTVQVVFCTSDKSYLTDGDDNAEEDLCSVVLDMPANGEMWVGYDWTSWGDFRLFALAITAEGEHVSVSTTLIKALTDFYRVYLSCEPGDFPGELQAVLKRLRENDGSKMRPATEKFSGRLKGRSHAPSDA
ncbi:hypothetical protein OKW20_003994 [Ensifer sp. LBL]